MKIMRRPLCLLCTVFVGILALCLLWLPEVKTDYAQLEGRQLTVEGQVYRKEYKESRYGEERTLALYLKSVHILNEFDEESNALERSKWMQSGQFSKEQVQNIVCYMKEAGVTAPEIGRTLRVSGRVRCFSQAGNPGEFDMQQYYRMMKLSFRLEDSRMIAFGGSTKPLQERLYRLKEYFSGVLESVFPKKEASVMKAMLLGEKNGLDEEIKKLYRDGAMIHILSISGLHISIIGMGLYRLFRRVGMPLKISALCSIGVICSYGMMTGMSMSAVRAILMFVLHLIADMAGRTYDMLTALALAAVVVLLEQPIYVQYSGFLFSFGAVISIGVLLPVLYEGKCPKDRRRLWRLKQAAASCGAVTFGTLPVHLMYYYQFPIYSYLLNLAVIPLMTVVMANGLFCMLIGGFLPVLARGAGCMDRMILWFYEQCCLQGGRIPGGILRSGRPQVWQAAGYSLLLAVLAAAVYACRKKLPTFWKCQWILAALCLLFLRTKSGLQITMLDVGQGDCIHIQSEEGKHYLIDGGSSSKSRVMEYQILPYLKYEGVGHLEAVFVTHSDSDHCSAVLDMLSEYPAEGITIGSLILPAIGMDSADEKYMEMIELAEENAITVQYMSRGQYMEDGGMRFTCMHPYKGYETREANEYSLVLLLDYGNFSGLFTGDVEGEGEDIVWEYMQKTFFDRLTLLKVAHHGSAYSTKEELLSVFRPQLALISCGKNNAYGHPHEELLGRLEDAGCGIYTTAMSGAVTVRTDGERVWVESFKR